MILVVFHFLILKKGIMHFKKLELIGFKSFAEKTELNFEPGVTAIVGPNGCGKSNIADGIKWVFGEQSPRVLRGTRMEDVIFNGTDGRQPINIAEVSLTISNESKILPIDYQEVTITRRIFRSGESEYYLNKTQVRLKDILELFMGTGIGLSAYSLMEQGKVDLILSSRPEERRVIFEEASGITKYKAKKKEALRKLEDTENNLLRVADIINEVERQIRSIERQAEKARRYKKRLDKLRELEVKIANFDCWKLKNEKKTIEREKETLKTKESAIVSELDAKRIELENSKARLAGVEREIGGIQREVLNCDGVVENDSNKINLNKERLSELKMRDVALSRDLELIEKRCSELGDKIEDLKTQINSLENVKISKKATLKQKEDELKTFLERIEEAKKLVSQSKAELIEIAALTAKSKNEFAKLTAGVGNNSARERRLGVEKRKIDEEISGVEEKLSQKSKEVEALNSEKEELSKHRDNLIAELSKSEKFLTEMHRKNRSLQDKLISLESQLEFLETLRTKYENLSVESRAVIITETAPDKEISTIISKPISFSSIDAKQKLALRDLLKNTFANFNFDASRVFSCSTKFITLNIEELKEKIEGTKAEIADIIQTEKEKEQILKSLNSQIEEIEGAIRAKEIVLANKNIERTNIEDEKKKLLEEASLVNLELDEIKEILAEQRKREEELKGVIAELEDKDRQNQELISDSQNLITSTSAQREQTLVEITRLKEEMVSLDKEVESLNTRLRIYEENLDEQNLNLTVRTEELSGSAAKREELNKENARLKTEIEVQSKKKSDLQGKLSVVKSERGNLINLLDKIDAQIKNSSNCLNELREQIHVLDIKNTELEYKQSSIKDRIRERYSFNLELEDEVKETEDWDRLRDEITHLREKLDSFGTVNLVAIEEHKELEERLSFLTHQQEDLLKAKESLRQAISKINRTTKELFMETFEKIQVEFRNFCRLLFGGGDGELILIDKDDVLESGIDILAHPPGKRLQNISLLSGGEKALTAIALLFAIFKVKPSPFCVLDEIDAPLDEANIDRFSRVLQDFVRTSQFIIITHNKKTITMADVMYGITMEESGISKIVSVKFSDKR